MKLGLQVVAFNWPGSPANTGRTLLDIARTADEAGFASLWVMDHYFQIDPGIGKASDPMLEAYTALSFMAGVTQRIRLGAMVTGVIYRQPAFLVKQVSTLDVLSGGRANLGIGAAWYEREAVGLGFPFPPLAERFERLEETLQIAKHLWSGETAPFEGKHYQLPEPINSPQPLSQPHPPILIGGGGEKKTLRSLPSMATPATCLPLAVSTSLATSWTCSKAIVTPWAGITPRSSARPWAWCGSAPAACPRLT